MKYITRAVWILSFVSLLTDMASEMLYPIMPIYLKSIGFSIILIGVLEGFAEATAGLSKGYFGKQSDNAGRRVPFVQIGYALSAFSKPMMAIFGYPLWIFLARTIDRFGKGIRTGARDALLSDEATAETKGKIFGFHRSMDTMGAVIGPTLALVFLYYYPEHYKALFYIAFLPGCLAVVASFFLKEKKVTTNNQKKYTAIFSFVKYWHISSSEYKKIVIGLLAFALFNSSDIFLLLKAKELGFTDAEVIGLYIFYNLVYAITALPLGIISDKIGLKKVFVIGLSIFSIVYLGLGTTKNMYVIVGLFLLYGIYAAATEGVSKAWISNACKKEDTATAIGTYSGFQSICSMLASTFAGLIWYNFEASASFIITAIATFFTVLYFCFFTAAKVN